VLALVLTVAVTFAAHLALFFPLLYFEEGDLPLGNFAAVGENLHLLAAFERLAYFAAVDDIPVYQNFFLSYVVSLLAGCRCAAAGVAVVLLVLAGAARWPVDSKVLFY
jgi:hypothetical protein